MTCLCLVSNPVAGSFRPARLAALEAALTDQGFKVTHRSTRSTEPIPQDCELVCVHGGDGTLRDTVQEMGEGAGRLPLAIAPSGTINLVARELGYARKPDAFAVALRAAWDRGPESWVRAPLYALGDLPVVSCLSIGPDSHAVARVSPALKKRIGRYAYAVALMQHMREWPRRAMPIAGELASGEPFACTAEAAIVSHGALYAGPFRLSPSAALKADSVELISLTRSTRMSTMIFVAATMLRLPLARLGLAEIRSCRLIDFGEGAGPVQVDGDHVPEGGHRVAPTGIVLTYVV